MNDHEQLIDARNQIKDLVDQRNEMRGNLLNQAVLMVTIQETSETLKDRCRCLEEDIDTQEDVIKSLELDTKHLEQQKTPAGVIRQQFNFWLDLRTRAQNEMHAIRQACPHENTDLESRNCDACGAIIGTRVTNEQVESFRLHSVKYISDILRKTQIITSHEQVVLDCQSVDDAINLYAAIKELKYMGIT